MEFQYYSVVPAENEFGETRSVCTTPARADLIGSFNPATGLHWPFLDLDFGASIEQTASGELLTLQTKASRGAITEFLSEMYECELIEDPFRGTDFMLGYDADVVQVPTMRLKAEAELRPSSTRDHFHLIPNKQLSWRQYRELMGCAVDANVIAPKYLAMSIRRGQSFLWVPGKKLSCTLMLQDATERRTRERVLAAERSVTYYGS